MSRRRSVQARCITLYSWGVDGRLGAKNARVSRLPVVASHMSTQGKSKRIESLYVLKAICAFFVITIHLPTFQKILVPIAGVGTPCFLCITGYLLYSASKERELEKCISWAAK